MYHTLFIFIHSSVDRHYGCFHFGAIMNNAAFSIYKFFKIQFTNFKKLFILPSHLHCVTLKHQIEVGIKHVRGNPSRIQPHLPGSGTLTGVLGLCSSVSWAPFPEGL